MRLKNVYFIDINGVLGLFEAFVLKKAFDVDARVVVAVNLCVLSFDQKALSKK